MADETVKTKHETAEDTTKKAADLTAVLIRKLNAAFSIILRSHAAFIKKPEEPERVHKLRISLRSYRSLVSLCKPYLERETYAEIQGLLRHEVKKTARLREIDVLSRKIAAFPAERLSFESSNKKQERVDGKSLLLEAFAIRRKEQQEELFEAVQNPSFEENLRRAKLLLGKKLQRKAMRDLSLEDLLKPRLETWFTALRRRMANYAEFSFYYIHSTRLIAKKLRYVSEIFAKELGAEDTVRGKLAKTLQNELGEICDAIGNQELILEILFPKAAQGQEQLRLKNRKKLWQAASLLILSEKEIELERREALEQGLWLKQLETEGQTEK